LRTGRPCPQWQLAHATQCYPPPQHPTSTHLFVPPAVFPATVPALPPAAGSDPETVAPLAVASTPKMRSRSFNDSGCGLPRVSGSSPTARVPEAAAAAMTANGRSDDPVRLPSIATNGAAMLPMRAAWGNRGGTGVTWVFNQGHIAGCAKGLGLRALLCAFLRQTRLQCGHGVRAWRPMAYSPTAVHTLQLAMEQNALIASHPILIWQACAVPKQGFHPALPHACKWDRAGTPSKSSQACCLIRPHAPG